jgi:hypothetical protein
VKDNIKNWSKFNESHWIDEIVPLLKWERDVDLEELFYSFMDIGFKPPVIRNVIMNEEFNSNSAIGTRQLYTNTSKKLYKGYQISCKDTISRSRNKINDNVEIYENLITLLKRIQDMGFKIFYDYNGNNISINLYHPSDVIEKKIYIHLIFKQRRDIIQ